MRPFTQPNVSQYYWCIRLNIHFYIFPPRARKDLRELFKKFAVTRKSLSDSSLEDQTSTSSPPTPPYTKLGEKTYTPN